MTSTSPTGWTFLTSYARVLLCIAQDPSIRLREIGERVGVTERAAHRIVGDLADAGYLSRERCGRRNRYTINSNLALPDPIARRQRVGDLLALLTKPSSAPPAFDSERQWPPTRGSHTPVGDGRAVLLSSTRTSVTGDPLSETSAEANE